MAGPFDSADAAKSWLLAWTCEGRMPNPFWKTVPGSHKHLKKYVCNAHANCAYQAALKRDMSGNWFVTADRDVLHSETVNEKRRSNSALTFEQEKLARLAVDHFHGTPGSMQRAAQGQSPNGKRKAEGGQEGVPARQWQPGAARSTRLAGGRMHAHSSAF